MSATFATESQQNFVEKTVDTVEDVKMETVTMTEQPQAQSPASPEPAEVLPDSQATAPQSESAPAIPGEPVSLLSSAQSAEGSSVDGVPLVDLRDATSHPASAIPGQENPGQDEGSEVSPEAPAVSEKEGLGETTLPESGDDNQSKPSSDVSSSINDLSNLARQIEDFDPDTIFKESEVLEGSAGSVNINDEKLIEDLVKGDNLLEQTEHSPVGAVTEAGETTPGGAVSAGEQETDVGEADNSVNDNDLSPAAAENGIESPNGSMSGSTESEGFGDSVDDPGQLPTGVSEEPAKTADDHTCTRAPEVPKPTQPVTEKKSGAPEPQKPENVSPSKVGKSKRKEDKSIEHILRALNSLQTTEEKLAALCKKYADLHEDHRIVQGSFKQSQRKLTVVMREKDQLQTEHTKAVMAKSKLESLCRELQKHNQLIRQESLQRAKEEDEKRKEISQKFQTTISEIQQQMQDNHDRNKKLREENFELASKLKKFIEQYEAREKQVEKVMQHRELEQKLADAKLEQASAILMEEKGRSQKEKEMLILQSTEYMKKMQMKDVELQMYKDRYEEFQSTISKSEEMFQKFKTEMDKMTKRIKKLEKEGAQWRTKWENANRALIDMAEEKSKYDKEKPILLNKITKLESLCRAMQAERQARRMLETEGVDISKIDTPDDLPTAAVQPPPPVPTSSPVPEEACGGTAEEEEEEEGSHDNIVTGTEASVESGETTDTVIPGDSSKTELPVPDGLENGQSDTPGEQNNQSPASQESQSTEPADQSKVDPDPVSQSAQPNTS